jgi:hypothetical protein
VAAGIFSESKRPMISTAIDPHATIDKFLNEITKLPSLPTAQDTPPLVIQIPIAPSLVLATKTAS